jgi:hypothetical protein
VDRQETIPGRSGGNVLAMLDQRTPAKFYWASAAPGDLQSWSTVGYRRALEADVPALLRQVRRQDLVHPARLVRLVITNASAGNFTAPAHAAVHLVLLRPTNAKAES